MRNSKRERLVRWLGNLGMVRLLTWAARRPGLLVLGYHRIETCGSSSFDDGQFSATVAQFRSQVSFLREHFALLTLEELLYAIDRNLEFKRPSALITFDDGYRDNYDLALPVLREFSIPAVFFIAPGYIDQPRLPWWDRIAYVVKNTRRPVLEMGQAPPSRLDLREGKSRAILQLLRAYTETPNIDEKHFFQKLEAAAEVSVDASALAERLFMSWDEIQECVASGIVVGGHSYNHPVLSQVSPELQCQELQDSKQRLESQTQQPVQLMAYPVGRRDCFDEVTKRIVQESGYKAAFSFYGGFNRPHQCDPFDIRRISVMSAYSCRMFRFRTSMCNLFDTTVF